MKTNEDMDQWLTQFRKGTFELAILALIRHHPMYGYEITSSLKKSPIFTISEGAIYPILKRMTDKEWIEFFWGDSPDGPRRKYYQITVKGERVLQDRFAKFAEIYEALTMLTKGGSS